MCKTWSIAYTCTHHWTARLSTCHATFTIQPKPNRPLKPLCSSTPIFTIRSTQACGDCQRAKAEMRLKAGLRSAGKEGMSFFEAEERMQVEVFKLEAVYPTCRQYRAREKAGKGTCGVRENGQRGSLLRREVLAEHVVDGGGSGGNGEWSWYAKSWLTDRYWLKGEYKTLDQELAEKKAEEEDLEEEPPQMDLPMTGSMGESMDDYLSSFEGGEGSPIDGSEQSAEPDELSWSSPWSEEPDSAESPAWIAEETPYWSSTVEQENAPPLTTQNGPRKTNDGEQQPGADSHRASDVQAPKEVNLTSSSAPAPACAVPSKTLPARRSKTVPPHRRSTCDSENVDVDLRERLKCLRLPHIIFVGGGD